jgi:NAD kinase
VPRAATDRQIDRVVVVTRRTELEELVARFNTTGQARFYLTQSGMDFAPIQAAHDTYMRALDAVMAAIPRDVKQIRIDRSLVAQFDFAADAVIALGPDGLVSNTAKYLPTQPLIGVNADPSLYDGVLLPWNAGTVARGLRGTLDGRATLQQVTMAEARTQDGRRLLAFNDVFIGARTHVSARYELSIDGRSERQSSSGIIVSTGAGSTGWLRSVHQGASVVVAASGVASSLPSPFDPSAQQLVFSVREPFPSNVTGTTLAYGAIGRDSPLVVSSRMSQGGVVFSDGIEFDFLEFNSGTDVTVGIASQKAHLVVSV